MKFQIVKTACEKFIFKIITARGRTISLSRMYASRSAARRAAYGIIRGAQDAEIVNE